MDRYGHIYLKRNFKLKRLLDGFLNFIEFI